MRGFLRNMGMAALLLAAVLPLWADEAGQRFLWQQANAQMAAARTPEAYREAAKIYARLVDAEGVCNGPLFVNLGAALVLAGAGAEAERAFLRAERYGGTTTATRGGLAVARSMRADRPGTAGGESWTRTAFFWHYTLPCIWRVRIALGAWCFVWIGLLGLWLARRTDVGSWRRSLAQACFGAGLFVGAMFGVSAGLTWIQERGEPPIVIAAQEGGHGTR